MFGSVFRMRPAPGKKEELRQYMSQQMGSGRAPEGFMRAYSIESGDDIWVLAIFQDEKTYRANANSPEQDADYRGMRALLAADPEWHDGEITEQTP